MKSQHNKVLTHEHSFTPAPLPNYLKQREKLAGGGRVCFTDLLPLLSWIIVSHRQEICSLNPAENQHKSGFKREAEAEVAEAPGIGRIQ